MSWAREVNGRHLLARRSYAFFCCRALTFAQRARCAAAILARAAAESLRRGLRPRRAPPPLLLPPM